MESGILDRNRNFRYQRLRAPSSVSITDESNHMKRTQRLSHLLKLPFPLPQALWSGNRQPSCVDGLKAREVGAKAHEVMQQPEWHSRPGFEGGYAEQRRTAQQHAVKRLPKTGFRCVFVTDTLHSRYYLASPSASSV